MGGCDRNDQMAKLHKSRRHYRWPRRLIMKCLMWSSYNAYIIAGTFNQHNQTGKRARTFTDFLDDLCTQLVGDLRSSSVEKRRSSTEGFGRLQNAGHFPERPPDATHNTCVVCRTKYKNFAQANPSLPKTANPNTMTKTVFRCSVCKE